jgi:hypothetical protein
MSWRVRTKWDRGNEDHKGDAHAHGWICVESTTVIREPNYCCCDDDAEVIRAVADDVDEYTHHGEISMRFVRGFLCMDMVFVMDVLVELGLGMADS